MKMFGRGKNGLVKGLQKNRDVPEGFAVVFPGPEGWELWSGPVSQPVCAGPAEEPGTLRPGRGCVMSLPARSFFSVPLWVPVVEDSPAREQTQIKLEIKGMLGANPDAAIWNFEAIRREQLPPGKEGEPMTRQLEATAVLAVPFDETWLVETAARYEPAGRMLPAPGSGAMGVLRRELGRWVADFYLGGKWLHTQPLLASKLDAAAAVELAATLAQLEGEGIVPRLEGWTLRDAGGSIPEDFRRGLGESLRTEDRSSPREPGEAWNLPPPLLTERRLERARVAQRKKLIRAGLLAYLAVGFLFLSFLAWPLVQLKLGQAELRKIGPESESIRSAAMLWREAGAWLDPRRNALELLWQVSRPLIENEPAVIEGVRLTLFDLNPKRLLLQGEGKDLERVEKYLLWLKNDPALAGFTWRHPQPRLLPNGNAQFQAEGIPPGVSTEEEEGGRSENSDAP
jgi:hypothetical protein